MKKLILTLSPALMLLFLAACKTSQIREPEYREIRAVRIMDIDLLHTTAGLDLVYYNPNDFGVQLNEARGDVYIDGMHLGRFGINDKVQVGKRKEFTVPAVIKLDNISAIRNHRDIWKKDEAVIRIEGFARVKKSGYVKEVPIRYEGTQNIDKLRSIVKR
jgi:LEA14-like dessication related protein